MAANRHPLPPADAALAAALVGPLPGEDADDDADLLTLDELAAHSDLPTALLEAVEREGLLIPRSTGDDRRYTLADAEALRAGLALVEAGLPLDELFNLAREHTAAMRTIADHAVELFVRFVRDPIRTQAIDDDDAAARLLDAFGRMLPATGTLVGHHFRRLLVNAAHARLQGFGDVGGPTDAETPRDRDPTDAEPPPDRDPTDAETPRDRDPTDAEPPPDRDPTDADTRDRP